MSSKPHPLEHLIAAGKLYPNAWKQAEDIFFSKGKDLPGWPDWCFLPMAGWYSIVSADAGMDRLNLQLIPDVARLAAIGTWRYTQGIYRFDAMLLDAINDTELSGDLPCEILYRLPEYCVYIETAGWKWANSELYGFWAHLEHDINSGRTELRLLLDTAAALIGVPLHVGRWSLTEAVTRMCNEAAQQHIAAGKGAMLRDINTDKDIAESLKSIISLILYICSEDPEITGDKQPGYSPCHPHPVKTKKGQRLFPPDRPHVWLVGQETGRQLREFVTQAEATGRSVRPHIRRQHWHGYWTGPKDKDQKFIYKWIPAILVGK